MNFFHPAISIAKILSLVVSLAACQSAGNPPLPTIVPAAQVTATRQPATPVASTATAGSAEEPATPLPEPASPTPLPPSATPTPPQPTATEVGALPPLEALKLTLEPVATGLSKPVYLTHAGDGRGRLFIVEQTGRILISRDGSLEPTPFLDISTIVGADAFEQGLLSIAFHPDYANNGYFFVYYTNEDGDVVLARYQVSNNPDQADPDSGQTLLTIGQPFANHNGGQLLFGPDGYLYVGLGDGGAAGDPQNNGQNLNTLLGKILRLDVNNGQPYGVPANNPFVGVETARPEIWSYGWRNPWRFSFDRATADMYIADVGQNQYEEISYEATGSPAGQNYGWRLMEGPDCFEPANCDPASLAVILPVAHYDHRQGCSVSGGYVYRGVQFPALTGLYLYGDFCSGNIWGLRRSPAGEWAEAQLLQTDYRISSLGEDEAGELYLIDHAGSILKIGHE